MKTSNFAKRLIRALVIAWLGGIPYLCQAREVTDMAGRKVKVPDTIHSVYNAGPYLTVDIYMLAPDLLTSLSFPFDKSALPYVTPRVAALPALGATMGQGRQLNPESLLAQKPDVALAWSAPYADSARTEEMFAHAGVPLVYVNLDTMSEYPAAMRYMGRLLGRERRGNQIADYIEQALSKVKAAVSEIPEARKVRVYYAESPDGLATECHTSFHAEPIALAGGYNVHRCELKSHVGMEKVSLEQVLAYNPEVIIAQDAGFAASVLSNPQWQGVRAVREKRVYYVPHAPFNWVDRPPTVMRAIGVQWLANIFYPERFPFERNRETQDFYRRFLNVDVSERRIEALFVPTVN